nr:HAD hydrolase family protein [Chryseobacterium sp. 3008163]
MKDIKMIVTDMDGTFLNSKHEVSPEFPEIYEELKKEIFFSFPQAEGRCWELPNISETKKMKWLSSLRMAAT